MIRSNLPYSNYQPEQSISMLAFPEIHSNSLQKKNKPAQESPKGKLKNKGRIVANLGDTKYQVVEEVCRQLGWKLDYADGMKWDIKWSDSAITGEMLSRMGQHQKINHFPGMSTLSRKNTLAKNIKRMQEYYPDQYMFIPRTFLLPYQHQKLRSYAAEARRQGIQKAYIVKPQANCQGRGIFLTQSLKQIQIYQHCVVQKYISNPLLFKGLKFDLRVYALIGGCDPLRIYIYNEGLVRLATQKYQPPNEDNMDQLCMHLTNYAINKNNDKYIFNDSANNLSYGHKQSLAEFFQILKSMGLSAHLYWSDIKDIIVKTIISGQPHLQHQYRVSQPNNLYNNMCFEVLGFDFMIDQNNRTYLLEVNHTPSFSADTPLDQLIKSNLIRDTLILMNITEEWKNEALEEAKIIQQRRVYTGKTIKMNTNERKEVVKELEKYREQYQNQNLGSYEKIYPSKNKDKQKKYQTLIQASMEIYKEANNPTNNKSTVSNKSKPIYQFRIKRVITNNPTLQAEPDYSKERYPAEKSYSKSKKQQRSKLDLYQFPQIESFNQGESTSSLRRNPSEKHRFNTRNEQMTMFSRNYKHLRQQLSQKQLV